MNALLRHLRRLERRLLSRPEPPPVARECPRCARLVTHGCWHRLCPVPPLPDLPERRR